MMFKIKTSSGKIEQDTFFKGKKKKLLRLNCYFGSFFLLKIPRLLHFGSMAKVNGFLESKRIFVEIIAFDGRKRMNNVFMSYLNDSNTALLGPAHPRPCLQFFLLDFTAPFR